MGLPLAIKVIGRSLSHGPNELWQKMVLELSHGNSILNCNTELLTYLPKILDVLEDDRVIKECFMDLGLFPQDQRIPVTALIDMWTELYGLDNDGIEAMEIINKLHSMNLANVCIARCNVFINHALYLNLLFCEKFKLCIKQFHFVISFSLRTTFDIASNLPHKN